MMLGLVKKSIITNTMKLTQREKEILELSACGCSVKEIAYELDLNELTVKVHLRNIHAKTGLQNDRETTIAYWLNELDAPVDVVPDKFRERIAKALLMLSVFSIAFHAVDMLRTFSSRTVSTRTLARSVRGRGRNYKFQLA